MKLLLCHRLNLGDLVCASPGIQWFAARHPGARIRLLTNDFAAHVGRLLPHVEHVYTYRKFEKGVRTLFRGNDIQPLPEWRALLAARLWRADRVVGLSPSADWRLSFRTVLAGGRPHPVPTTHTHVAETLAALLGWDGAEPLPEARLRAPQAETKRDVAIFISARKQSNRPTADQVLKLVENLLKRGQKVGVFGLPGQTMSSAHQAEAGKQTALQTSLAAFGVPFETPDLERYMQDLAESRTVITPDGGMAHIAAAFGKPCVVLFGNVDPPVWRPYTPRAAVLQAPTRRVADLSVSEILEAWERISPRSEIRSPAHS